MKSIPVLLKLSCFHRGATDRAHVPKKRVWGPLNGVWVEPDKRDQVVDFVQDWSKKTRVPIEKLLDQVGLAVGKFYDWRKRYGAANRHNGKVPRDFWMLEWAC